METRIRQEEGPGSEEIPAKRKKVIIAYASPIFRECLRTLLSSDRGLEVVGEANSGREMIETVQKFNPALVITGLFTANMTKGVDAIKAIKRTFPETKVLVLTEHKGEEHILGAFEAGANGYVLKSSTKGELRLAIQNVLEGRPFISPEISGKVVAGYTRKEVHLKTSTPWDRLSSRERAVLKLVAEGYRNKEMADFLCISLKTVEKHRASLMKKLDVHSPAALTLLAIQKGLISC